MSYRRALVGRWSRRDRLAVVVVAVAVAFLTGATLVVLAVGSSTTAIAADYGTNATVTSHASVQAAEQAAGPDAVVVPLATVEMPNGTATVAGVPEGSTVGGVSLRGADTPTLGRLDAARNVTLRGDGGQARLRVAPRSGGPFPADWYVAAPATVDRLGGERALVVTPADGVPARGAPMRGVLAFFIAGTRSALATLSVAAGVGATLVGVTVYSVTRMTVRDRLRDLFVLRATGATRWDVRRLFLERGLLLLGVGVALGYAVGVITTNLAVNVAVAVGLPTSLSTRVTAEAVRFLLPTYGGVVAIGALATLAAVQPELSKPPGNIEDATARFAFDGLGPRLLSMRTVVPTAATLAAFVTFLLVVAGLAGVAGPLAAGSGATITEPDSTHPIASDVPAAYAEPLRDRGIAASPEILLFLVSDGQPFPARGANYSAFSSVTDASLVAGEPPASPDEAVIGADLADTLGVGVGDRVVLGGSLRPAVTRVTVVGTFTAPGPDDDQLVVSLATARHLTRVGDGQVNFIRAERLPDIPETAGTASVTDLSAPSTVAAGESFTATVTVRNDGLADRTVSREVRFGGTRRTVEVRVPASGQRTTTVEFLAERRGTRPVVADDVRTNVTVLAPDAVRFDSVPERAPPRSAPLVRLLDARGRPVAGATVTAGNWSGTTGEDGTVRVSLNESGERRLTATRGNYSATTAVMVTPEATRRLTVTLRVAPSSPSQLVEPTATATVGNPWAVPLTRSVALVGPTGASERTVTVAPGGSRTVDRELARRPPGRYEVALRANGTTRTAATYRVTGDERVVAALATSGRSGSTGIGQAVQVALGNLELAVAALVLLGAGMTVGGAAATFAGAVHGTRRTVGVLRAVGQTRATIARLVLGDALRLGVGAVLAAVAASLLALQAFDAVGLLTIYGVAIPTTPSVAVLAAVAGGSLFVVGVGAGVAAAGLLAQSPAALLDGGDGR
ncbi:FtsX-like permease family protein [Halorarius halobius]|uniref:FtsX-like permease family protein n=1 Tax=Halorarius halobius TaxID=2962671 RepID=UPI0020CCC35F|nr:FtsX-like permease family protein [Halorarius halobius]